MLPAISNNDAAACAYKAVHELRNDRNTSECVVYTKIRTIVAREMTQSLGDESKDLIE